MYEEVISFWFTETSPAQWWSAKPEFDALIARRFGELHRAACKAELFAWRKEPKGRLAEVIVLDQFPRNMHRNSPLAFASDPLALALAQEAVVAGADTALDQAGRMFLYLPFVHSESRVIQAEAERLVRANGHKESLDSALRHREIIDRFGRYPHRNEVLGRESTAEEIAFLRQPGSRF
ncbi:MAG: DUF924 family protein [Pseudomonadota bacterium]